MWAKAERLQVQVLEEREDMFGKENPETLTAMHNLVVALKAQSHHCDDERMCAPQRCCVGFGTSTSVVLAVSFRGVGADEPGFVGG